MPIFRGRVFLFLLVSFLMITSFVKKKHKIFALQHVLCFLFLILLSGLIIICDFNSYEASAINVMVYNTSIIFFYFVYFFTGYFFGNLESRKKIVFFLWFLLIGNLLFHYDFQLMRISLHALGEDSKGIYLFLGDSFALWSLLVLSFFQNNPIKSILVTIVSILALFSFNSRTSLYSFILVLPMTILFTKNSIKYFLILFISVFLLLVVNFNISIELNQRMLAFINIQNDTSFIARSKLLNEGLDGLKKNWFLGDYAGQLSYGGLGAYMHNYLSLWRQFGLIPFLIFCVLLFISIVKLWRFFGMAKKVGNIDSELFFLIVGGMFCLIEIIAARSYNSPFIWFFIGRCASLKTRIS